MADGALGTPAQLRDPNYTPPLARAVPLGIQHVLAMFVSNVTPAIIVAGAAGFGFGSDAGALGFPDMLYMIQMSMLFAGVATLLQTRDPGPVGAALPIVQGTSFAFLPIMIPLVAGKGVDGLAALYGGVLIGGMFHASAGAGDRQDPLCAAAAGDRAGGDHDRSGTGQGWYSICGRRGACDWHA